MNFRDTAQHDYIIMWLTKILFIIILIALDVVYIIPI